MHGKQLNINVGAGIIVSNLSLVLQGVSRTTAGNYSCVGYNTEGDGESKPFFLNVLYTPTCKPNQTRIYGVAKKEEAEITCKVDANPPDVEFRWTFNNSADSADVAQLKAERSGTSSIVSYTPKNELDYGTLLCYASNKIGAQRMPCVFHIIAAEFLEFSGGFLKQWHFFGFFGILMKYLIDILNKILGPIMEVLGMFGIVLDFLRLELLWNYVDFF
ncbi:hypothetical protein NQ317_016075 [Molorchus minor]|uniref:Ig-like domain-containing protein n=1 Tax=Molorchus minor TaxID=1323400 RepID=A0ABQ9ITU5_9CUCU|nr:hypothetical protein NQ317_016075 [Molorchus minor]